MVGFRITLVTEISDALIGILSKLENAGMSFKIAEMMVGFVKTAGVLNLNPHNP